VPSFEISLPDLKTSGPILQGFIGPSRELHLSARAKRASRRKFEAVLAKVPDLEPEEFDRLPAGTGRRSRKKDGSRHR
jgi:hypothetical protein